MKSNSFNFQLNTSANLTQSNHKVGQTDRQIDILFKFVGATVTQTVTTRALDHRGQSFTAYTISKEQYDMIDENDLFKKP